MSRLKRCKRQEFIKRLIQIGFTGPYSGHRHQFMLFKSHRLAIPSNREYSVPQLRMMLNEIGYIMGRTITDNEWNNLK